MWYSWHLAGSSSFYKCKGSARKSLAQRGQGHRVGVDLFELGTVHTFGTVLSLSQDIGGDGEGTRFIDLMEADQELPDAKLLDIEQTNSIRNAVDQLPSHLREILLLSYFQQMSYVQIADSLQIPLGTVKSRLHAAVAAFSQSWHSIISEDDS